MATENTIQEVIPAETSDITPEQIQGEQDRIAESFGEHNITKIGAEGNLAGQQAEPLLINTDRVREDVKADSDQVDLLGGATNVDNAKRNLSSSGFSNEQISKFLATASEEEIKNASAGINFSDIYKKIVGDTTTEDQELEAARVADMNPAERELYDMGQERNAENDALTAEINSLGERMDSRTQAVIQNIKNTFAGRIRQMETINKNVLGSQKLLGARSGRQRYAQELQTSIIANEERDGIDRIAGLDAQMNSLILQAEQARDAQDYQLLNTKITLATQAYNEKRQAILDLATLQKDQDEALANKAKQAFEENKYFQEEKDKMIKYDAFNVLSLSEDGVDLPDNAELEAYAELQGYDTSQFVYEAKQAALELSKLSQEDQKSTLELQKLEKEMSMMGMSNDQQAFQFAVNNLDYSGSFFDYLGDKKLAETNPLDMINKQLENAILEKKLGDTGGGDWEKITLNGEDYIKYENGLTIKASDVFPPDVNPQAIQDGQRAIEDIDYLLSHGSLDMGVGPNAMTRKRKYWFQGIEHSIDFFTAGTADFVSGVEQMVSGLSLAELISAKARGATFGALSDSEMILLSKSATKIGSWKVEDKNGKVIGYEISEKTFKAELRKIQHYANLDLKRQMGINYLNFDELIKTVPDVNSLMTNPDYMGSTIEETRDNILQFYNQSSFNNVGSDTQPATPVTGTISGLSAFDTFNTYPGVNRSDRNNNPGNIKVSSFTKQFDGVAGVESKPAEDGGNFLVFASTQDGINAVGRLLSTASPYKNVKAEQAIKRYNGNGGYGARDVGLDPNKDFQEQLKDSATLQRVIEAIMRLEGFTGVNNNLA